MTDGAFWDLINEVGEEMAEDLPKWTPTQVLVWLATDPEIAELLTEVATHGPATLLQYLDVLGPYLSDVSPTDLSVIDPPEETS